MNRSIRYERLFPMGQYVNVKFVDEVNDLPEAICMNEDLMNKIRYLQMVDVELSYRIYLKLYEKSKTLDIEELAKSMEFLETEREVTIKGIEAILNPNKKLTA
jgi:hypothetical protein